MIISMNESHYASWVYQSDQKLPIVLEVITLQLKSDQFVRFGKSMLTNSGL